MKVPNPGYMTVQAVVYYLARYPDCRAGSMLALLASSIETIPSPRAAALSRIFAGAESVLGTSALE